MRKFYYWLFVLFSIVQIHAQTVTIGSGTNATSSSGSDPIDGYFQSFRYQVVYTAAELTAAGMPANSEITSLGFSISGDYGGGNLLGYTIRMGATTAVNSASHVTSTTQVVKNPFSYNPTVTTAGNFDMITLDAPFLWDGTSNILIDICSSGPNPYTSPYGQVRTIAASTTNGSRFVRADGGGSLCGAATTSTNTTKPQIRFTYGPPASCPVPTSFINSAVTANSASFTWGGSGNFEIEYGLSGFAHGTGTVETTSANSITLNGLTTSQPYQAYIRKNCGSGDYSTWVGPVSFTPKTIVTYTAGAIGSQYSSTVTNTTVSACPATLSITVPPGKRIASLSTEYSIIASTVNDAYMSEQRSYIYSPTLSVGEASVAVGSGSAAGTMNYSRALTFANNATGTINFEIRVFRTYEGVTGCNSSMQTIPSGSWKLLPVFEDIPAVAPNCATGLTPANSATNVARNTNITWSASANATSYDVYFGTSSNPALAANVVATSYAPGVLLASTQYYYKVVPKNPFGEALGCTEVTFTTSANLSYCAATVSGALEVINNVTFAGINNRVAGTAKYEDFTSIIGSVVQGSTANPISVSGNTAGNYTDYIKVYIDWNQDGSFNESDEKYQLGSITNCTACAVTGSIGVPAGAVLGNTRMRVIKSYGGYVEGACGTFATDGQVEDYTIAVQSPPVLPPDCATALVPANAATGVMRNSIVSWTAATGYPTSYDVYFGTVPNPALVATTTALSYDPGIMAPNSIYYWRVVPKNANGEAMGCDEQSFTTGFDMNYCAATYSNGCGGLGADAITSVVLGDLTNTSGCAASPYYTYYNAVTVPNLMQGSESVLQVTMAGDSTQFSAVWIDYNQNGILEPSEGMVSANAGSNGTATFNLNVPAGAVLGQTRMRIRGGNDQILTTEQACGISSSAYGETEDYIVNIVEMSTDAPDWYNVQWPPSAEILAGGSETIYAQAWEPGVTEAAGAADGLQAWIGISPSGSNTDPSTWTNWVPAAFNVQSGNNDEFSASIGSTLVAGTYYYASRFRLNGGPFVYGGVGGPWNNDSGILVVNANPTQCATDPFPANGATGIPVGGITISWTAPSTGPAPTSYDVYGGNAPGNLTLVGNYPTTSANVNVTGYSSTVYWKIVPKSAIGGDAADCVVLSFTTQADPFAPYCSGMTFTYGTEPITLVNFAGINNTSSAATGGAFHEDFTHISGEVTTESTYQLTLKGNTDGNWTDNFRVFFDWNQDGDFNDAGETHNAGSISNSTGLDGVQAVTNVTIPSTALPGPTRMRVKKIYGTVSINNPCLGDEFGQFEDYTINVTVCTPLDWYADADGDGYGNPAVSLNACNAPAGYVSNASDCDDNNDEVYQSAELYVDADNDGYTSGETQVVCYGESIPAGFVAEMTAIDCNDEIGAINPGAAEIPYNGVDDNCDGTIDEGSQVFSQVQPSQCGTTLTNIGSLVGAISVPGANGYRFEITNMTTNEVQTLERGVPNFSFTLLPVYDYATTYSIRVMVRRNGIWLNYYGESCLVATPAITAPGGAAQVNPSQCGVELESINTLIATTSLPGVAQYRFRVTDLTDADGPYTVQILDRPLHWFNLKMLSRYNYGSTYSIEVAVRTTNSTTFTGFGAPCNITTPPVPMLNQCDQVIPTAGTNMSTKSLLNVTQYRFVLTSFADFAVTTVDRPLHYFRFHDVPNYVPGGEYGVQVAVMTTGEWSPLSDGCIIIAPGGARDNVKQTTVPFDAVAYPNPFADTFNIELTTSAEANVNVKVYDMTGRMLEHKEVPVTEMQTLQVGERYPAGVYNVIVTQGDQAKTLRVIKR